MRFRFHILALTLAIVPAAFAYEYPLSPTAIRDAYFRGSGPKGEEGDFYAKYIHNLSIPQTAPPVSYVSIETPYLQIAEHARGAVNYDAQDAVEEFLNRDMKFEVQRLHGSLLQAPACGRLQFGNARHQGPASATRPQNRGDGHRPLGPQHFSRRADLERKHRAAR